MNEKNDLQQIIGNILNLMKSGDWESAKLSCIQALSCYPINAQIWVYLGETLERLSEPTAAWRAYDRAWLLDPQASWIDVVRARLSKYRHGKIQPWLKKLLFVPPVTVSAALIVKNEERIIGQCIERLRPAVDEIVVVDTGSTDNTKDILKDMGIHPYDFEWNDDFGAARNYALTKVSGDWVLCVDADELLLQEDTECPRTVAGLLNESNPPCICRVGILNKVGNRVLPLYDMSRFFPTRFGLRFWGRVHEQIGPPEGGLFAVAYPRPAVRIRFEHDGYQKEVMNTKSKFERNIRLLRASIQHDPDDIVSWGFLGRELLFTGQIDEAIDALSHTEALMDKHPEYGMASVVRMLLINALLAKDRIEDALDVANRVCESDPSFPDVWYTKGKVEMSLALKYLKSAQSSFETAINTAPYYRGILSFDPEIMQWKAVAALGDVAKMNGNLTEARRLYSQAKNWCPDNDVLEYQLKFIDDQRKRLNNSLNR
jgi:tetratricopeptide (TPR) repeat protein